MSNDQVLVMETTNPIQALQLAIHTMLQCLLEKPRYNITCVSTAFYYKRQQA